nr:hypothetical protein [uncultured Campylobacter sp.]
MESQVKNFLQNCEQIVKSQVKQYENRSPFATKIPPVFILPYDEFEQKFGSDLHLDSSFDVLVFDGDLSLPKGTINSAWLKDKFNEAGGKNNALVMFVNGNLSIGGDIVDDDYLFLQVAKDTACNYLHSQDGVIAIGGNLTAIWGISGEYNDGMLQVFGKTQAPYIVSNDHAMPGHSASECVYVLDGQIGQSYLGALEGWDFFENSELMFKDGICEDEYQINISTFFKFVKKGINPLVDFKTFEARKAAMDEESEEQEPEYAGNLPENSETVAEILNLENFSGSNEELYEYMAGEFGAIEKVDDESEKYAYDGRAFELSIIAARMAENWRLITQRYSAQQIDELRKIIIKSATNLADYFLKIGDKKQLAFIYEFLNDEAVSIEKDEPFLYETLVRAGLELKDYDNAYALVSVIDKKSEFLPQEMAKSIADVIKSEGYWVWLAKQ